MIMIKICFLFSVLCLVEIFNDYIFMIPFKKSPSIKKNGGLGPLYKEGQFEAINLIDYRMITLKKSRIL